MGIEVKAAPQKTTELKAAAPPQSNFQKKPVVFSGKLCKHGNLCWSQICPFRHPERENGGGRATTPSEDSKSMPPFKTRECWRFMKYGNCNYGNTCHFAHGKHELRNGDFVKIN